MTLPNRHLTLAHSHARWREGENALDLNDLLLAPTQQLLCEGGDERIAVDARSGTNVYGCAPSPNDDAISFASSTASPVSGRARRHLLRVREQLLEDAAVLGVKAAIEKQTGHMREALRIHLGLENSGAEVVFSPSGTDSQMQALMLARSLCAEPLTVIVCGSDQTGSGTTFTAAARHFSSRTARGKAVLKGSDVADWSAEVETLDVAFADRNGRLRDAAIIDRLVVDAVADAAARGRRVVLLALHASKLGWRAPSDACLEAVQSRWPTRVLTVIDACQMRIGRRALAAYIEHSCMVLITGSKFTGGPAFSGALLVPPQMSRTLETLSVAAPGLRLFADRSDVPETWPGLRMSLDDSPNLGQFMRWQAALLEMRDYCALPRSYREAVLARLALAIPAALASSPVIEFYAFAGTSRSTLDEEFRFPTIFPFLLRNRTGFLTVNDVTALYRDLSQVGPDVDPEVTVRECRVGQPVTVHLPDGTRTAALRIALGARTLVEAWSPSLQSVEDCVERTLRELAIVIDRLESIIRRASPNNRAAKAVGA